MGSTPFPWTDELRTFCIEENRQLFFSDREFQPFVLIDILFAALYNMQVNLLKSNLPAGACVTTPSAVAQLALANFFCRLVGYAAVAELSHSHA